MRAPLAKSVVAIESGDNEDTGEGVVFKRRRKLVATPSHSSTHGRPSSFREHPPSTSSPHGLLPLEGGDKNAPTSEQTRSAPELPVVLQHALKGFQRGAAEHLDEDAARARLGLSFDEVLAQSNAHISRTEVRVKEQVALVEAKAKEELAKAKEDLVLAEEKKKEELAQLVLIFTNRETALDQELSSLR